MRIKLVDILLVFAVVGTALIDVFPLPQNLALADVALAALVLVGSRTLLVPDSTGKRVFARLAPWLWLYVFGQLIGIGTAGLTLSSFSVLARNALPIVVFVVVLAECVDRRQRVLLGLRTYLATGVFVSATLLAESAADGRVGGIFGNPNYPAHFLAVAIIVSFAVPMRLWLRTMLLLVFAAGLFQTGSFMALMLLAAAAVYALWQVAGRLRGSMSIAARSVLVLVAVVGLPVAIAEGGSAEFDAGSGFDSTRLERSATSRFELWQGALEYAVADPTGVGPGNEAPFLEATAAGEVHNDLLDALLQGGFMAAVGMVGMVVVIWRLADRGGVVRVLLAGLVTASLFRQTWNFRHMWIALALTLAMEMTNRGRATSAPPAETAAEVAA